MILVVGGYGSGRRTFARTLLAAGERLVRAMPAMRAAGVPECACLADAQELVRADDCAGGVVRAGVLDELADALARLRVVTIAEVGCGVVPVAAEERAWREAAGRLGCMLAARAECVVRMTCGVPCAIKGVLPPAGGLALHADAAPSPARGRGGAPC